MKPPRFAYAVPATLDEALGLLRSGADVLAGGQSLVPELSFRERRPELLVDINRIRGLDTIEETDAGLRIGALVRHADLERSALVRERCPMLARVVRFVAHPPVRNRGTVCGSIANAHPAAELAAVLAAGGGEVELRSRSGERRVPHHRFVTGPFTTIRRPDELVTAIHVPAHAAGGFHEITRREREYALAGAVALVEDGAARIGLFGVEASPRRLEAAAGDPDALARAVRDEVEADDYRRHLAGVAVVRAVQEARS